MASSTKNRMLAVVEKKTVVLDLYNPLRRYIVTNYSENDARSVEDDLQTLNKYRLELERIGDPLPARRQLLEDYYRALCVVESRFPISSDKDHVNIWFTWLDAFKTKFHASQPNIHFEKAAVLFNLGAVHSQIGVSCDRSTVEGRKQALHSFIAAAGAFALLKGAAMGNSTTLDISVECTGMLERLMLAQAQECVYENTIARGSSPGLCAKISKQVGIFYEETMTTLSVAPLNKHVDKAWLGHIQLKAALFDGEACYRYNIELHQKEKIGEEITRLKVGILALSKAKKSSPKGAPPHLLEAINTLENSLNANLEQAVKENERVYYMRVPPATSLQRIPSLSMVKPFPMNEVLDASKEKLFASLVSDKEKNIAEVVDMDLDLD